MTTADSMPLSPLEGQLILILGASSGIGEAVSRYLGCYKIKLVLAARRLDRLDEVLLQIRGKNPDLILGGAYKLDVTKRKDVQEFYGRIVSDMGKAPDVVVNCAGVMYFTLMKNQHWDEWEQTIDVNCKGVVNSCGAALPYMLEQRSGHIVNISSDAARQTFPALSVYNASKAFVHEFTKGLRCECVGTGVRVTEILPGDVRTDLIMQNSDKEVADKLGVQIGCLVGGETIDSEAARNAVLDAQNVAEAVFYAITVPQHVGVNEILIEPRDQMFGDPTAMGV